MGVRILGTRSSRWRAAALLAALATIACDSPTPRVDSLLFTAVPEGTSRLQVLSTSQCAPPFDLDQGTVVADPMAVVQLDPGRRMLAAERTGDEQFQTTIPGDLLPGAYDVQLHLTDGRVARYDGQLTVTSSDPVITGVTSAASTVTAGQPSVPLSVVLTNPGLCGIDGLAVTPVFLRGATDVSGDFRVHGGAPVHLDAGAQVTVDLTVDVSSTAAPGTVSLDARGTGGTRNGPSCSGTATATSTGPTSSWQVAPP